MRLKSHLFLLMAVITIPVFVLSCTKEEVSEPARIVPEPVSAAAPAPTPQPTPAPTAPEPVAAAKQEPAAASVPAKIEPAAALVVKGPSKQPANHSGRKACLVCHAKGTAGAPKAPANHAGRTDASCSSCHKAQ